MTALLPAGSRPDRYLEHPAHAADAVIRANEVRRVELHILRALDAKEIGDAIGEAFERNSADGSNLKAARALGMTTIRVGDADAALVALEGLLGLALRA